MKPTLSQILLFEFSQLVADKLGLYYPKEKWMDLERAIKEIARANQFENLHDCVKWLMHSLPNPLQIDILANYLTIGETYFFREKSCFAALKNHLLPELIAKRKNKTLRIWSAPCSSGEEPYSIAILLCSMISNIHEWNITILASDINQSALDKMKAGVYTEWSFRETAPEFKKTYFNQIDKNKYAILPSIKNMVTPLHLNLSQDSFPQVINGTHSMDLIFCRNMLMYFAPEQRILVIDKLCATLSNEGHMIVGASETALVNNKSFTIINYPNTLFFKKDRNIAEKKQSVPTLNISPKSLNPITHHAILPPQLKKAAESQPPIVKKSMTIKKHIDLDMATQQFRDLTNKGELGKAITAIDEIIAADRLNPIHYFYKALLFLELNQEESSILACKNAIYLNPDFVMPYFILGNILYKHNKVNESQQYYQTVLNLLSQYNDNEILPGSEGLNSQKLKEIIMSLNNKLRKEGEQSDNSQSNVS